MLYDNLELSLCDIAEMQLFRMLREHRSKSLKGGEQIARPRKRRIVYDPDKIREIFTYAPASLHRQSERP